ncbi:hypothetical protein D3874_15230 [Oleomonas cavernae]|uniref:Uncharacterized protein n=1 Tax=Oleomonas cavernae TaxID=2320859 RepID=A0A418WDX6_9PROT|nr:hypothetical protein D3874_15230 [Oleomonas cavernae]
MGHDKAAVADSSRGSAKAVGAKETADARVRSKALTDAARTYASASELGPLNAAHASLTAFEHAAPNSTVGRIASYDAARQRALSLVDPVDRRRALRLAERRLALDFDRTLTRAEINAVNAILDDKR